MLCEPEPLFCRVFTVLLRRSWGKSTCFCWVIFFFFSRSRKFTYFRCETDCVNISLQSSKLIRSSRTKHVVTSKQFMMAFLPGQRAGNVCLCSLFLFERSGTLMPVEIVSLAFGGSVNLFPIFLSFTWIRIHEAYLQSDLKAPYV